MSIQQKPTRILLAFAGTTALLALTACGDDEGGPSPDNDFLTIGGASSGGTFYAYSGAYGDVVQDELETIVNVEETGGSVENVRFVVNGDNDLGVAQADVVADALNGVGDFDSSQDDLRILGGVYPNYLQLVATQDSGLEMFEDIITEGAEISVGPAGGGQEVTLRTVTEALDHSFDDFGRITNLGFGDQNAAFRNEQIDVGNYMTARGTGSLIELSSVMQFNILELGDDDLQQLLEEEPYFIEGEIPGDTYDGFGEDVTVPALWNYYVVHADADEELVYDLTKILYENTETVEGSVPQASETSLDNVAEMSAPLHPGAARYFEEQEVEIPDEAQPID